MLKARIIPVLTFNGISLIKTKQFKDERIVGNPIQAARVYNSRQVDELVFLDIYASKQNRKLNLPLVKKVIDECFMPVTIGGGISTFDDVNNLLKIGADKVLLKTKAINDPRFIEKAVNYFGSQCISISVDVIRKKNGYYLYDGFNDSIEMIDFIRTMNSCNVGEYVINSVDNDGMMNGYDVDLIKMASEVTNKPIVALGGVGVPDHFISLIKTGFSGALAASSIYHFTQFTPQEVKKQLKKTGFSVRL